jgi:hypothetical protein
LRDGPLPPREAAALAEKVARALQAAHDKGVLHRDLTPACVRLTAAGEPVVTGFELARREGSSRETVAGQVLGTPAYLAPERLTGQPGSDTRAADIYSLGAVLYEMLTRELPFGRTMREVLLRTPAAAPVAPSARRPGTPAVLDAVCLKALAADPARRYRTMAELAEALQAWSRSPNVNANETGQKAPLNSGAAGTLGDTRISPHATPPAAPVLPQPAPDPLRRARRRRVGWATAVVILVSMLAPLLAYVLLRSNPRTGIASPSRLPDFTQAATTTPADQPTSADKPVQPVPVEGTIRLRLPDFADAATILLDGQPCDADKLAQPLRLPPGEHRLEVSGIGIKPLEQTFLIKSGENASLDVPVTRAALERKPGLLAELYRGQFDRLVGAQVDPSVELSSDRPLPPAIQAAWWRGFLSAPNAGTYRFYFLVDDAVSLWLDGKLLLDEWKWRGLEKSREVTVELRREPVPIEVKYYNVDMAYGLQFLWVPPGGPQAVRVPPEAFSHDPLFAARATRRAARPAAEPDQPRIVAAWALGLGGTVTIQSAGGEIREIRTAADLPFGPFTLEALDLTGNVKVTDTELKTLFRQVPLKRLILADTQVGDAGLSCCEAPRGLEELNLGGTAVTDTNLMALRRHSGLRSLDLRGTKTTAAGIERLREKLPDCTIKR